ncbi:MAG: acyltransferase domain-containing protein, partial [Candidatus Electrothrix sp. ATG2]|nr:acyltransferase domain-containing protein [Candidatus Electrothrix sp. ATG2]
RAGVSARGFGGINTHITVEEPECDTASSGPGFKFNPDWARMKNIQDAELFLFSYSSPQDLIWTIDYVAGFVDKCSLAEFTDLAAELTQRSTSGALSIWRAATVAKTPKELAAKLRQMSRFMESFNGGLHVDKDADFSISGGVNAARIGFLFSGQGAPVRAGGGNMGLRFQNVRSVFEQPYLTEFNATDNTDYAQVAITMANLSGMKALQQFGISADLALGHSLGELSALNWAGCVTESDLMRMVFARGNAMTREDTQTSGAMVAVTMDSEGARHFLGNTPNLFVANINSEQQTVISGSRTAIDELIERLELNNIGATKLRIKQAFHSPFMQKSAELFKRSLQD